MKKLKIFLICGKARQGKDTIASIIKENYESKRIKTISLSYSYYIKDYAKRIIGWDGSEETKPREFLQFISTDLIKNKIDKNFFVRRMIEDIKVFSNYYDIIVIPDVRLRSEIDMIREEFEDVCAIHVERTNFESELTLEQKQHYTEIDLDSYDNYDYKVINDGSLEDLKTKIINILKEEN